MIPTFGQGKICYIELPAGDVDRASEFYRGVFGWNLRKRDDGTVAFDDGVGQVSGSWITTRGPVSDGGPMIYVMVDDIREAMNKIGEAGGTIVTPYDPELREKFAHFRDPEGNVLGIYEHRGM